MDRAARIGWWGYLAVPGLLLFGDGFFKWCVREMDWESNRNDPAPDRWSSGMHLPIFFSEDNFVGYSDDS